MNIVKELKLIKIGSGSFTTAYTTAQLDRCYIKTTDMAKLAYAESALGESSLYPKVEKCLEIDDAVNDWYIMPLYTKVKAPSKQLKYNDLDLYNKLREAYKKGMRGYEEIYNAFNTLAISDIRIEELNELLDAVCNYIDSDTIRFEISPRNIALDSNGDMVLLDCFYCADALAEQRN